MIKRTIEISRESAHLSIRNSQLVLQRKSEIVASVPCEDLGAVVVDHPQTTYTHAALAKIADAGAVLVVCGRDHIPSAVLLPLADHSQIVWRLADQIAASKPLCKQLWRQLVVAKIRGQARNLGVGTPARNKLNGLAREVRSGDVVNREALAAKIYWSYWLDGKSFKRDPILGGLNGMLNYGYAIVRAAIARSLVAAGLQPSIGLHHCNRSNAFCLADDLIEPFRPMIDERVRGLWRQGYDEINQAVKAELLGVLNSPLRMSDQSGPMMVMLSRLVASLVRCYAGESRRLEIPQPCESADTD